MSINTYVGRAECQQDIETCLIVIKNRDPNATVKITPNPLKGPDGQLTEVPDRRYEFKTTLELNQMLGCFALVDDSCVMVRTLVKVPEGEVWG